MTAPRPHASAWISSVELAQARASSPEYVLRSRFGQVKRERGGRTLIVPQVLRADLRDRRWVGCDWGGQGIGDSVAVAQRVLGCGFVQAVRSLLGHEETGTLQNVVEQASGVPDRPRLPPYAGPGPGRAYLASRGVEHAALRAAEACGALRYLGDGVMFVGMDLSGAVRSATVRFLSPKLMPDGSRLTKRDLRGTDKAFPVVLEGDPDRVVIVEGAVSGLAAQSLSALAGRTLPTAVVTGGVNPLRWISEPNNRVSSLIPAAARVIVLAENELGPDGRRVEVKQERTDAARVKVVEALASARSGSRPRLLYPPQSCKDAADWLAQTLNSRR